MALDLGCGRGHIGKNVLQETVGVLVQCDLAEKVLVSYELFIYDLNKT